MLKSTAALVRTCKRRLSQLEEKIAKKDDLEAEATRIRNAIAVLQDGAGAAVTDTQLDGGGVAHVTVRRGRRPRRDQ